MDSKLLKLKLDNFRNLENSILEFSNTINCIFGENGNGKTNILEAIHFLVNKKSFRKNTSFPQLISIESEKPQILFSSLIKYKENQSTYSGTFMPDKSIWHLDNSPIKRKLDIHTVFINPFDSYAFHTTPSFRRDWFDTHLSKLDKVYKSNLTKYNQSLRFRNTLLNKKPADFKNQIKAIDLQLAKYSVEILNARKKFILELKDFCQNTFKSIFDESHDLEIKMDSKFLNNSYEEILKCYEENLEKDIIIGKTRYGIHRDDYVFHFDGFNSYEYCSLGQQKMSFLSLIFAYIELFRYKLISYPLVLIDDVSGELDSKRWKNLINYLKEKNFQVFITTANKNFRDELEKIDEAKKFFVDNGSIINL
ncbi:MAG: DNA replication and repair protein RecF [Bacteriovoracaceae bacterium]|jgi:DNA replication and repair protein RecF|nr:DNA replication and repair protein RecF [Bacteriovoracaceae bacterium]